MPHLTLEYSPNVLVEADFTDLFRKLHAILSRTGGIRLENCKSRAYVARECFIGSGAQAGGFIHLDIRFLEGRSDEIKRAIGEETRDTLMTWFQASVDTLDLQITVEVRDIERSFYFKFPEGSLTP